MNLILLRNKVRNGKIPTVPSRRRRTKLPAYVIGAFLRRHRQKGVRSRNTDPFITQDSWGRSGGFAFARIKSPLGTFLFFEVFMKKDALSDFHPVVSLVFFLGAIGFGVVIQHPAYLLAGVIASATYFLVLKGAAGGKTILAMLPVMFLVSILNPLFNTRGKTVLFFLLGRPYTLEALYYGIAVAAMLAITLLWFGCYSQVMTGNKFTALFGRLLPSLSLLLVMVLRLIPALLGKAKQIATARQAIGKGAAPADTPRQKIAGGMRILSALTDWALEGSVTTADSMRARGYGAAKRTCFQIYKMTVRDYLCLGLIAGLAIAVLAFGRTEAHFVPRLSFAPVGWGYLAYCSLLLLPVILNIKEAIVWHILRSRI